MSDEKGKWKIGQYTVGLWHFIFDTDEYDNSDIVEVGERIVKR